MGVLDVFSTSSQGMNAQSFALQNISGNIANSTTTGFKRTETAFSDLVADSGVATQSAGSVAAASQLTTNVQGTVATSTTSTNMALNGSGYFVVAQNTSTTATPSFSSQSLYTRRGDFAQDQNGYLVNGAGYYLAGTTTSASGGVSGSTTPIKLQQTRNGATLSSVAVGNDGTVTGTYSDGQSATIGKVTVANLATNAELQSEDGGAYSLTDPASVVSYGLTGATISGGALEQSNTDISDQFSKMIVTQQAYQANSKALTTANDMLQAAINILR